MIVPNICVKYKVSFENIKYDELVEMYQNYNTRDLGILSVLLYNSIIVIEALKANYIFLEHIKNDMEVLNFDKKEHNELEIKEINSILEAIEPRIKISEKIYFNIKNQIQRYIKDYFVG